ncbi:MAG: hypothetical protein V8S58_05135 [Lachnospiraceae bacterium]
MNLEEKENMAEVTHRRQMYRRQTYSRKPMYRQQERLGGGSNGDPCSRHADGQRADRSIGCSAGAGG